MRRVILLLIICCVMPSLSYAQTGNVSLLPPFDFPLCLSGNFGELRTNHFHSGLDFKTQGVTGLPIRCVADGYICRAAVTPGGYGKALYVMHDNGYMTVYAHLDRFPKGVEKRVRDIQYKKEQFGVNVWFKPGEFPVHCGEVLAFAGNSGYSFGPHLHFEVRDASGNELYDPLRFYKERIKDTTPPKIYELAVYPKPGKGALSGGADSRVYDVKGDAVPDTIEAWGDIAFGIRTIDFMDGTNNKYGVYKTELVIDGDCRFSSSMENFSFSEDLYINSWVDYGRLYYNDEWFQKLYVAPNNRLRLLNAGEGNGWLSVNEERLYNVECKVTDFHGNAVSCSFVVKGKRSGIPPFPKSSHTLYCNADNKVEYLGMRLSVPRGVLFEDAFLNITLQKGDTLSWRYCLADTVYPMLRGAKLSLWVGSGLPVDNSKLYIRHVEPDDSSSVGGTYENGWLTANIRCLSCYEAAIDTVAPELTPINKELWSQSGAVSFEVAENETSLSAFKGTIDGKFILFEYSSKNKTLTLDMKREGVRRGKRLLRLSVTDDCGNESVFEEEINY